MGERRNDSLILVAGADPARWQEVRGSLGSEFAVAFAIDLRGTFDSLDREEPAVLVLCSDLLDASVDDCLERLGGVTRPKLRVIVLANGEPQSGSARPKRRLARGTSLACPPMVVQPGRPDELRGAVRRIFDGEKTASAPTLSKPSSKPSPKSEPTGAPKKGQDRGLCELPSYRSMILGTSPAIRKVAETIRKIARVDVTILLSGETGTGKELFARRIHCMSDRARGPFRPLNLPAVPRELFESVLFGHERGAFTGAVRHSEGAFEQAEGGTLFLDEISSLDMAAQPKLLRAIQEKEVERVGSNGPKICDVRLVAASNTELLDAVERREFREDLYHRLSVVTIDIPPLRERAQDIPLLVQFFLDKYVEQFRCEARQVTPDAMRALQRQEWKGNIRQLENCVQRALLLSGSGDLQAEDFLSSLERPSTSQGIHFGSSEYCLAEVERAYIEQVMRHTENNQSRAAQILGIDRKTLRAKRHKTLAARPAAAPLQSVS